MATAGADGTCDVSPKGDAPGFVLVLDERRLVIPERPGNKRFDGMKNLLDNPHIGLIFSRAWTRGDAARQRTRVDHQRSGSAGALRGAG